MNSLQKHRHTYVHIYIYIYVHTCITLCYIYVIYYDIKNKMTTKFFTRKHNNLGADHLFMIKDLLYNIA